MVYNLVTKKYVDRIFLSAMKGKTEVTFYPYWVVMGLNSYYSHLIYVKRTHKQCPASTHSFQSILLFLKGNFFFLICLKTSGILIHRRKIKFLNRAHKIFSWPWPSISRFADPFLTFYTPATPNWYFHEYTQLSLISELSHCLILSREDFYLLTTWQPCSSFHSFIKWLLKKYCVSGYVLDSENAKVNKILSCPQRYRKLQTFPSSVKPSSCCTPTEDPCPPLTLFTVCVALITVPCNY